MPGEGHYPIWAGRCRRAAGGWGRGSFLHTRGSGVDPETQGMPGPARQPPSAPPGHVRASPCVRARRAGGGQSGAAAHLVPGEPLAPASPQTRGPDTQTLIDRRAQPRAARARRRPASQSECGVGAGGGGGAGRSAHPPPPLPASCLPSSSDTSLPTPAPESALGPGLQLGLPFPILGNQVHGKPTPVNNRRFPRARRALLAKGWAARITGSCRRSVSLGGKYEATLYAPIPISRLGKLRLERSQVTQREVCRAGL